MLKSLYPLKWLWLSALSLFLLGAGCVGLIGLRVCEIYFAEWGLRGGEGPLPTLALMAVGGILGGLLGLVDLMVRRRVLSWSTALWLGLSLTYCVLMLWVGVTSGV